ncbi:MAG: hypothetical protein OEY23_16220 [Acidimicrobiia bacterium]|nr:hypothetical protein [Acidimicrobiia bacterium]
MVAFITSVVVGLLVLVIPFRWALKRVPANAAMTWGQAMVAAMWAFFLMFWWYGVVPHQWLTWADNELNWRVDKRLLGPRLWLEEGRGIIDNIVPFQLNYLIIRDFIAVGVYLVALGVNMWLWGVWQKRGTRKTGTDLARSEFGRPLAKPTS